MTKDQYTHGHHESVLRSHRWRTAENSAGFLLPHLFHDAQVLDVGCGPGTISVDLARLVAPGLVRAIDISEEVIEAATSMYASEGPPNIRFSVDDVYDLSFDEKSFDVVYAHQVLQHLSDPVSALREMRRVLRDDGVLAVRDADYGAFVWTPQDPRLDAWMDLYQSVTSANRWSLLRTGRITRTRNERGGASSGPTACATALSRIRRAPLVWPMNPRYKK